MWFDSSQVSYEQLLETFWRMHDPTTPNRQGLDVGDQYRSAIFVHDPDQAALAASSRDQKQHALSAPIVTEITPAGKFYKAEEYHQRDFERQGRAAHLAVLVGVRGIPFVVLYRGGEPAAHASGAQPKAELERALGLESPTVATR